MYTVKKDTTLVGVSELRNNIDKVIEEARRRKVVIEKRNKAVAVLVAIEQYSAMEEVFDLIENIKLGRNAKKRDKSSKRTDYISIEKAYKKIKDAETVALSKLQHKSARSGKGAMRKSEIDREIASTRRLKP